jgi:aspartate dehydrogenase
VEDAARAGNTQVHVLSGAIGGIDAIAAARWGGLSEVTYTGRKPPQGWRGSAAESVVALDNLREPTVLIEGSAAEVALQYPKNANVAATIAFAGLGLQSEGRRYACQWMSLLFCSGFVEAKFEELLNLRNSRGR